MKTIRLTNKEANIDFLMPVNEIAYVARQNVDEEKSLIIKVNEKKASTVVYMKFTGKPLPVDQTLEEIQKALEAD